MKVEFTRSAEKDLRKIDRQKLPAIFSAIEALGAAPLPNGVKKLAGSERTYRIRVGEYRVVYDIERNIAVILVVRVRHRKDVYR